MKNLLYSGCFVVSLLILSSCTDSKNKTLIIGSWQGTEWLVNGQPSSNNAKGTSFTFDDKGGYSFDYDGSVEKGTYKVDGDKLYSTPSGQQEIMVKINKLTSDSLVFDMNRGGQAETLTLLKKK